MNVSLLFVSVILLAGASSEPTEFEEVIVNLSSNKTYNCGLQKDATMGGSETRPVEFPWTAALEYEFTSNRENAGIRCGGSVVSERYIITPAHCIHPSRMEIIKVWVGMWRLSAANTTEAGNVQKLDIEEQIPHEQFNYPRGDNDIGLLRLAEDIKFTDFVRPICLPKQDLAPPPLGTMMTVAGWGKTKDGTRSDVKLKVELPLISSNVCTQKLHVPLGDNQLCMGAEGRKDACHEDSGGPLMINFTDTASRTVYWYQTGIVYLGHSCGYGDSPTIYTRVSQYTNWIANNIK